MMGQRPAMRSSKGDGDRLACWDRSSDVIVGDFGGAWFDLSNDLGWCTLTPPAGRDAGGLGEGAPESAWASWSRPAWLHCPDLALRR